VPVKQDKRRPWVQANPISQGAMFVQAFVALQFVA
jgi:hypothetical protein